MLRFLLMALLMAIPAAAQTSVTVPFYLTIVDDPANPGMVIAQVFETKADAQTALDARGAPTGVRAVEITSGDAIELNVTQICTSTIAGSVIPPNCLGFAAGSRSDRGTPNPERPEKPVSASASPERPSGTRSKRSGS